MRKLIVALLVWLVLTLPSWAMGPAMKELMLIAAPSAPAIDLNFANGVDPRIVYTGQNGTYFNSSGVLTAATTNKPRIDWSLGFPAMLVEESRTNLWYPTANWVSNQSSSVSQVGITQSATTSPDGTSDGMALISGSGNINQYSFENFAGAILTTYTASVYVKANGYNYAAIGLGNTAFANNYDTYVNLTTCAIDTQAANNSGTSQSVGNGWCRVTVQNTTQAGGGNYVVVVSMAAASGGNRVFTGNGTSGIYIYGLQVEAGSFATSLIKTTSGSVTRAADVAYVPTSGFRWNNQSYGTLIAQWALEGRSALYSAIAQMVGSNVDVIYADVGETSLGTLGTSPGAIGMAVAGAASNPPFSFWTVPLNSLLKSGSSWSPNYEAQAQGTAPAGQSPQSVLVNNLFSGAIKLQLAGAEHYQSLASAWIKRLTFYPYAMSASQLANATK